MKRGWRLALILIAVACFGVALSYPIRYRLAERSNRNSLEALSAMRLEALSRQDAAAAPSQSAGGETAAPPVAADAATETPPAFATSGPASTDRPAATEAGAPDDEDDIMKYILDVTPVLPTHEATAEPSPTPAPSPTPDRYQRTSALAYPLREKVTLDESRILPELKEIYAINSDLVGWLSIPGTDIDYPVVQCEDSDFYLTHDFYRESNRNGQIILEALCDPYTPSYNLVISGHNMLNGSMFAGLVYYSGQSFWQWHRLVEFDTLMERKQYVIIAAFFSAAYDDDEEGFRYNADIQYRQDAEQWLAEIRENQLYDTGIDAEFGDEFLTLTTCSKLRRSDGRFVLICRKIREGESF